MSVRVQATAKVRVIEVDGSKKEFPIISYPAVVIRSHHLFGRQVLISLDDVPQGTDSITVDGDDLISAIQKCQEL
jgi:hypothetical protein